MAKIGGVGRLIVGRRKREERKKLGLCIYLSCSNKAILGYTYCKHHQEQQREYGKKYREGK